MQFLSNWTDSLPTTNDDSFSLSYLVAVHDFNKKSNCVSDILFKLNKLPTDAELI